MEPAQGRWLETVAGVCIGVALLLLVLRVVRRRR
jgi:hypothetical protein